uniref:Uncharacterized protein n=1 Tax=Oryza sativa subsp. japonica TaxID=39947 RepID=Q6H875_ORYSJ|nr:hypothetical protein [Oryza sativa Japonica Group]
MRQKLQSSLEASAIDIEDVPYKHAGHTAVKDNANETHFNIRDFMLSQLFKSPKESEFQIRLFEGLSSRFKRLHIFGWM